MSFKFLKLNKIALADDSSHSDIAINCNFIIVMPIEQQLAAKVQPIASNIATIKQQVTFITMHCLRPFAGIV